MEQALYFLVASPEASQNGRQGLQSLVTKNLQQHCIAMTGGLFPYARRDCTLDLRARHFNMGLTGGGQSLNLRISGTVESMQSQSTSKSCIFRYGIQYVATM